MEPTVVMATHDDWLVNVLLADGRFYTFNTEMWACHSINPDRHLSNMMRAVHEAKEYALELAREDAPTWGLDAIPDTTEQFVKALNFVCMAADDATFSCFVRR